MTQATVLQENLALLLEEVAAAFQSHGGLSRASLEDARDDMVFSGLKRLGNNNAYITYLSMPVTRVTTIQVHGSSAFPIGFPWRRIAEGIADRHGVMYSVRSCDGAFFYPSKSEYLLDGESLEAALRKVIQAQEDMNGKIERELKRLEEL